MAASLGRTLPATGILALLATAAFAQNVECGECHEDVLFSSTAHPDLACSDCHTNVTAEHEGDDLEPLTDEMSCNECHARLQRTIMFSVHGGEAARGDCHGSPHEIH